MLARRSSTDPRATVARRAMRDGRGLKSAPKDAEFRCAARGTRRAPRRGSRRRSRSNRPRGACVMELTPTVRIEARERQQFLESRLFARERHDPACGRSSSRRLGRPRADMSSLEKCAAHSREHDARLEDGRVASLARGDREPRSRLPRTFLRAPSRLRGERSRDHASPNERERVRRVAEALRVRAIRWHSRSACASSARRKPMAFDAASGPPTAGAPPVVLGARPRSARDCRTRRLHL